MTESVPAPESSPAPRSGEVADLEYDATIPPRPEEDVADAVREDEDKPRHLDG